MRVPLLICILFSAALAGHSPLRAGDIAPNRDDRVGICTHFAFQGSGWPPKIIVPLLEKSGAGWIRDDLPWGQVERKPGVYQLPPYALNWIDAVHAAGLKIDLIFNYGNKAYPNPYDPQAYARAAAWTAAHLAGKIQAMEIMNEPANFGFSKYYDHEQAWSGLKKSGEVADYVSKYVALINAAAPAIRAANPDLKIIGLGCSAGANFHALAMGIAPEVDGLTDHPYSAHTGPELVPFPATASTFRRDGIYTADEKGTFASQVRMYREQSAKYNGPKEIWLTEQGWPTFYALTSFGLFTPVSEEAQAKYILRRLTESAGLGVTTTFIYDLRDDGATPGNPEHHFGLLDFHLRPKPSFVPFQRFCAAMSAYHASPDMHVNITLNSEPETSFFGGGLTGPGAVRAYAFVDDKGTSRVALWYAAQGDSGYEPLSSQVDIEHAAPVKKITAYDPLTGKTWDVPFQNKNGHLVIDDFKLLDSPVFLTMSSGSE